jgi:hypothetical protein
VAAVSLVRSGSGIVAAVLLVRSGSGIVAAVSLVRTGYTKVASRTLAGCLLCRALNETPMYHRENFGLAAACLYRQQFWSGLAGITWPVTGERILLSDWLKLFVEPLVGDPHKCYIQIKMPQL